MAGNITLDNLVSVRDDNTVHKKAARRIKKGPGIVSHDKGDGVR